MKWHIALERNPQVEKATLRLRFLALASLAFTFSCVGISCVYVFLRYNRLGKVLKVKCKYKNEIFILTCVELKSIASEPDD